MSYTDIQQDVALYTALHQAIAEVQQAAAPRERRRTVRRPFAHIQLLAPYDGAILPAQHEYSRVLCQDLSPSGFSYLAEKRPATRLLVTALGRTPFKFFVAEVVNHRLVERQGAPRYLVGCRFLKRIE